MNRAGTVSHDRERPEKVNQGKKEGEKTRVTVFSFYDAETGRRTGRDGTKVRRDGVGQQGRDEPAGIKRTGEDVGTGTGEGNKNRQERQTGNPPSGTGVESVVFLTKSKGMEGKENTVISMVARIYRYRI